MIFIGWLGGYVYDQVWRYTILAERPWLNEYDHERKVHDRLFEFERIKEISIFHAKKPKVYDH